ncbi:hypothetical protein RQP46_005112 [Phenoliferia psychrophenolica]
MEPLAIPKGSLVLVTGANGFIGSHISNQLLLQGFNVRGATRSLARIEALRVRFEKEYGSGRFEGVEVKDFGGPGAYDQAMKGCAGVIHVASNLSLSTDADVVCDSVVTGDLNILRSAAAIPTIKRFVLTSSTKAGYWPTPDVEGIRLDATSWNERSLKDAWMVPDSDPLKPLHVYSASKVKGERAMWNFMEEEKPGFVLNAVLPDLNFGEFLDHSTARNESTGGYLADVYRGDLSSMMWFAPVTSHFVDVSDVARIHVGALFSSDVTSERIWAATTPFHINEILRILRKLYPHKKFAEDQAGFGNDWSVIDTARGEELLRRQGRKGWIGIEESVRLNTKDLETMEGRERELGIGGK